MKKYLLTGVAAIGMAFAAVNAQAAFIGTTPATNDVIGQTEGWFDANLYLNAGGPVNATLEFIGKEAGFRNTFNINGGATEYDTSVNTGIHFPGGNSLLNIVLNPGLLAFCFSVNSGADSVCNGANPSPVTDDPNFFVTFGFAGDPIGGGTPSGGTVVLIALDDAGAGPDDNHDDLVVRLTLTNGGTFQVPEPGTLGLLSIALLGLGFASRRRRG